MYIMYGVQQMCQCASEIGMIVWEVSDTIVKSAGKVMSYTLVTQNIGKFMWWLVCYIDYESRSMC